MPVWFDDENSLILSMGPGEKGLTSESVILCEERHDQSRVPELGQSQIATLGGFQPKCRARTEGEIDLSCLLTFSRSILWAWSSMLASWEEN